MSNKQTSIEWLRQELWEQFKFSFSDNIFEQAKEMHYEEIEDAWENGADIGAKIIEGASNGNEYYQETFKND